MPSETRPICARMTFSLAREYLSARLNIPLEKLYPYGNCSIGTTAPVTKNQN